MARGAFFPWARVRARVYLYTMGAPSTSTVTLRVSKRTKAFIERRTAAGNFASTGASIESLVLEKLAREEKSRIDELLKAGLTTGKPTRVDENYTASLEARYLASIGKVPAKPRKRKAS
jgi:Arc/MetJ-type ribon-helix-helix transcriptional regulator